MKFSILFFAYSILILSQINEIKIFNLPDKASRSAATIQASNGDLLTIWGSEQKLYLSRSSNNGDEWSSIQLDSLNYDFECIRAFKTSSERILVIYKTFSPHIIYSDDNGQTWSSPALLQLLNPILNRQPCGFNFNQTSNEIILSFSRKNLTGIPRGINYVMSEDNGLTWSPTIQLFDNIINPSLIIYSNGNQEIFYHDSTASGFKIKSYVSSNDWQTWTDKSFLFSSELDEKNIKSIITSTGKAYLVFEHYRESIFDGLYQSEIAFVSSTDNGISWSDIQYFSSYKGEDVAPHPSLLNNDKILTSFLSNRFAAARDSSTLLFGILEESLDNNTPPYLYMHLTSSETPEPNEEINVEAFIDFSDDSVQVYFINRINLMEPDSVRMFDDGMSGDSSANDKIFGAIINGIKTGDILSYNFSIISPDFYVKFNGGEMFIPIPGSSNAFLFDVNKLKIPISNNGVIADVEVGDELWGKYDEGVFLFSGGFFLGGKIDNQIFANAMASGFRIQDYEPGNIGVSSLDPKNILYTVRKSDPHFGSSWQDWKFAVEQGADYYDGNNNGIYDPIDHNNNGVWDLEEDSPGIIGDLTAWCVYNDGVASELRRFFEIPRGIEVQQTMFANSSTNTKIENIVFIRYRLINKGTTADQIESVYFGVWADPDLGDFEDDLIGADTLLNSIFSYNDGPDGVYGTEAPAFYISLIQGPKQYIPGISFVDNNNNGIYDEGIDTPIDSAKNNKGIFIGSEIFPGAKNLDISSAIQFIVSLVVPGDPNQSTEAYNNLLGYDKNGNPIDPCTWHMGTILGGELCDQINPIYFYSGDPVNQIGWINNYPADQRQMLNTGPFTLMKNEPVDIIAAYVMGRGTDHLNSLTVAKQNVEYAKSYYDNNFTYLPVAIDDEEIFADDFQLYQNYPNPFNPSTIIRYSVSSPGLTTLKVYDILGKEVTVLINEVKTPGVYEIEFSGESLSSGVYFYQIKSGKYIKTNKMMLLK
jgi:hypothetical protein